MLFSLAYKWVCHRMWLSSSPFLIIFLVPWSWRPLNLKIRFEDQNPKFLWFLKNTLFSPLTFLSTVLATPLGWPCKIQQIFEQFLVQAYVKYWMLYTYAKETICYLKFIFNWVPFILQWLNFITLSILEYGKKKKNFSMRLLNSPSKCQQMKLLNLLSLMR